MVSTFCVPVPAIRFVNVSGVSIPVFCTPRFSRVARMFGGRLHWFLSVAHCWIACMASITFFIFWMSSFSSGPVRLSLLFR